MPAPHAVIPVLEGLVSTMPTTGRQVASEWVRMCKVIMHQTALRDETDWSVMALSDIDEDGAAETNTGDMPTMTNVYGLLVANGSAAAERNWVVVSDSDTLTFDGTAALANTVVAAYQPDAAGTAGVEELHGMVWPFGLTLATGCTVAADGRDGTNPTLNDLRGWILYRT